MTACLRRIAISGATTPTSWRWAKGTLHGAATRFFAGASVSACLMPSKFLSPSSQNRRLRATIRRVFSTILRCRWIFPCGSCLRRKALRNCYAGVTIVHRSGIFGTSDILGDVAGGADWLTAHYRVCSTMNMTITMKKLFTHCSCGQPWYFDCRLGRGIVAG